MIHKNEKQPHHDTIDINKYRQALIHILTTFSNYLPMWDQNYW
jgi:hypothetical protein